MVCKVVSNVPARVSTTGRSDNLGTLWTYKQYGQEGLEERYLAVSTPLKAGHTQHEWWHDDPSPDYPSSWKAPRHTSLQHKLHKRRSRHPQESATDLSSPGPQIKGTVTANDAPAPEQLVTERGL